MILHVSHVLLQLTRNIYESFVPPLWYMCIDLRANVYSWSLSPMKTLRVIVYIAGSSKAVGNLASTGLHLLFILFLLWTDGLAYVVSPQHIWKYVRKRQVQTWGGTFGCRITVRVLFFSSNGAFGEKEEIQIYCIKWKRKQMKESSIYLTRAAIEALRGWPSQSWNYFGNRNIFITGSRVPKIQKKNPIRPKLYSSFDQCGICISRCRTRLYPVQLECISLLDICF